MKNHIFITADKLDKLIIKELLKDPLITALEISLKLRIPLSIVHRKRRLIESKVLQTKYLLDFKKLGLNYRLSDVFADIQEDKVKDFIDKLYTTPFNKNILKVMKVKSAVEGVCIKTIYQDSEELFFFMDKIKSYPFISNVHFSEQVEMLGDNTLQVSLNLLN